MARRRKRRRGPAAVEDIVARAARLGITPDRVLQEYARIAFADLRRIVDWGPGEDGLRVKVAEELDPADVAAIAEIVASASTGRIYRIKLHDKPAVLGAVARHLGMLPALSFALDEDEPTQEEGDGARDRLVLALDRIAVQGAVAHGNPEPEQ